MKNLLYIPFLLLMAVTYTRLVKNYNSSDALSSISRGPASVEVEAQVEGPNQPGQFNPHYISEGCSGNISK
jgi:hypothetical protein